MLGDRKMLLLLFLEQGNAIIPMLWFRNVIPQLSVHTEALQTMQCSFTRPSPSPSPCSGLERGLGGTKGKNHVLRYEFFHAVNSNGIRKQTVTVTISVTEETSAT